MVNFNAYDNSRKSKVKVPVSGSFYAHAFSEFPVNLPENVGIFSSKQAFTDRFQNGYLLCVFSRGGGGGGWFSPSLHTSGYDYGRKTNLARWYGLMKSVPLLLKLKVLKYSS